MNLITFSMTSLLLVSKVSKFKTHFSLIFHYAKSRSLSISYSSQFKIARILQLLRMKILEILSIHDVRFKRGEHAQFALIQNGPLNAPYFRTTYIQSLIRGEEAGGGPSRLRGTCET